MAIKKVRYVALTRLWHSKDDVYIETGEEVNLDHLYPDTIQLLIEAGAVEAVPEVKIVKPMEDKTE